jgi:hypothetical protein
MTGKIKVGLSLNEKLFTKFREFLAIKYGLVAKGLISNEVELALESHMADHRTHANGTKEMVTPNPSPAVFKVKEEVRKYMKDHFGYDVIYQVPKKHVMEAIAMVRGSDPRTIKGWMKKFHQYKVLKYIGVNQVEFL